MYVYKIADTLPFLLFSVLLFNDVDRNAPRL
jgi:hypothetical protein